MLATGRLLVEGEGNYGDAGRFSWKEKASPVILETGRERERGSEFNKWGS